MSGDSQDSRGQHVRGQRRPRRHRSVSDRPDGPLLVDTRFLSRWVLTVDGKRLNPLSVDDLQYFETRFFLVPGTGTVYVDAKLSVIRQRAVGGGFHEEITVLNHAEKARGPRDADRGRRRLRGPVRGQGRAEEEGRVLLGASTTAPRARLPARDVGARDLDLGDGAGDRRARADVPGSPRAPRGVDTDLDVTPGAASAGAARRGPSTSATPSGPSPNGAQPRRVDRNAPRLECDWDPLKRTYQRSLVDLAALRFSPPRCRAIPCRPRGCRGS